MRTDPAATGTRDEQIRERIAGIRVRLDQLASAQRPPGTAAGSAGRLREARQNAALSATAAHRSLAAAVAALRRSAEAHEHAATSHESAQERGGPEAQTHRERAIFHRIAAMEDLKRASRAMRAAQGTKE